VRLRRTTGTGAGKSKTTAILLAVFLGFWTWIYTYREDGAKFWIACVVGVVNFFLAIATLGIWLLISIPVGIGFWIWAIVDTAGKSDEWYAAY
jgi:hypothetical protein